MGKLLPVLLGAFLLALVGQAQQPSPAQAAYLDAYVEMLRADVRGEKIALISQALLFTEQEAAFWPLYNQYDRELNQLNNQRIALIKDFAANFSTMTDEKATGLANRLLDWEENRVKFKRRYFSEFNKVLTPIKAARLLQLENKVNLLIDLQISAQVPLVE